MFRLHSSHMVYIRQGQALEGIRKLDEFHSFLKCELGVEPGNEIWAFRRRIRRTGIAMLS